MWVSVLIRTFIEAHNYSHSVAFHHTERGRWGIERGEGEENKRERKTQRKRERERERETQRERDAERERERETDRQTERGDARGRRILNCSLKTKTMLYVKHEFMYNGYWTWPS